MYYNTYIEVKAPIMNVFWDKVVELFLLPNGLIILVAVSVPFTVWLALTFAAWWPRSKGQPTPQRETKMLFTIYRDNDGEVKIWRH